MAAVIAYVFPIFDRRLKPANPLMLQELHELRRLAQTHATAQEFIDEQQIGLGTLRVRFEDGASVAEDSAIDVALAHDVNTRVWPNVHVLCPPLCGLFDPDENPAANTQDRRRFLYTAARRAPHRLILEVVERPTETLEILRLQQLARTGRI